MGDETDPEDDPKPIEPTEEQLDQAIDYLASIDPEVLKRFTESLPVFKMPEGLKPAIDFSKVLGNFPIPFTTADLLGPKAVQALQGLGAQITRNMEPVRKALEHFDTAQGRRLTLNFADRIGVTDSAAVEVTPLAEPAIDLAKIVPVAIAGLTTGAWFTMLERLPASDPRREMLGVLMGIAWSWLFAVLYQGKR